MSLTLKPSELIVLLVGLIKARLTGLVTGAPGIGKTDLGCAAAAQCGIAPENMVISHPVLDEPIDIKGYPGPMPSGGIDFLPIGDVKRVLNATQPTLWFIDDIGQATPSMQAAYMRPLISRAIAGNKVPDCVSIIGATNRRVDRAGVSGILEPVKSRFTTIVELRADLDDWCHWAINSGVIPPMMLAFMRHRGGDLLSDFKPTADLTNSPCPRTWANCARIEALKLPASIEHVSMAGSVGEGAATEYLAFRKMAAALVSVDAILTDPHGSKLPEKPAECYAVSTGLASRANDKTISRIGVYAERLAKADKGEFAALIVRDSLRRTPAIANTGDYAKLMCGPLGALISGKTMTR